MLRNTRRQNLDLDCGLTGEMVAEVFCWKEDEWAEELRTMGFYMGKFIYLMDAYEDYDRDRRKTAIIRSHLFRKNRRRILIPGAGCF